MPDHPVTPMDGEIQHFERRRRRVYSVALVLVIGVVAVGWLVHSPDDTYRRWTAPIMMVVLAVFAALLWRRRIALARLEPFLLIALASQPLSRQVWLFHFAGPPDEQWLRMLGNNYWAVSALLVFVCTIMERRRGSLAGAGIVVACAIVAAIGLGAGILRGTVTTDILLYVLGGLLFMTLFLVLMSGATVMRDQWQGAMARAEQYSQWAMTDRLTGLANRRAADESLELNCATAKRHGRTFSVILADLDEFKHINDSAGHATGDAVLIAVAETLRGVVRDADILARWGGEEFAIIIPGTDLDGAGRLAERCREAIERADLAGYRVTMTFGVAQYAPGDDIRSLMARADANLYRGKAANRNRVETHPDPQRAGAAG